MQRIFFVSFLFVSLFGFAQKKQSKNFYELRVYEYHSMDQEAVIEDFVGKALIPYMHTKGVGRIGVFTNRANDTSKVKKLFVLIPYRSLAEIPEINKAMFKDETVANNGAAYLDANPDTPPFDRITNIILEGFRLAPSLMMPRLTGSVEDKVYELRSYEGPTEKKYWKKVEMFNEGGEIDIFARLNFNPVFYAETISGPTMPNLMYMTSFNSMKDRDEHWKAFGSDPKWVELKGMKEYDKTVSKNVTLFLKAKPCSEY